MAKLTVYERLLFIGSKYRGKKTDSRVDFYTYTLLLSRRALVTGQFYTR